jgi:PAS domain S-box-containing protein
MVSSGKSQYSDFRAFISHIKESSMKEPLETVLHSAEFSLKVLQVLTENSFDSIVITDATHARNIIYANRAFKKLTGYDPSEVIGKTPRILQGPSTDKKVIAHLAEAIKKNSRFEGKAINYKKDGTPFIMHWRVLPVKVGKQTRVWVAIQREGSVI